MPHPNVDSVRLFLTELKELFPFENSAVAYCTTVILSHVSVPNVNPRLYMCKMRHLRRDEET